MATAYTEHTATAKQPYMYRFDCEHCGQGSGWIPMTETGMATQRVNGRGQLSAQARMDLQSQAASNLRGAVEARKKRFEAGKYGAIKGKCPHCGKRQSWELKGGKGTPWLMALSGTAMGFVAMIFAGLLSEDIQNAATILIPIGFATGLIVGYVRLAKNKLDAVKTAQRNKPEIMWPQDLTIGDVTRAL